MRYMTWDLIHCTLDGLEFTVDPANMKQVAACVDAQECRIEEQVGRLTGHGLEAIATVRQITTTERSGFGLTAREAVVDLLRRYGSDGLVVDVIRLTREGARFATALMKLCGNQYQTLEESKYYLGDNYTWFDNRDIATLIAGGYSKEAVGGFMSNLFDFGVIQEADLPNTPAKGQKVQYVFSEKGVEAVLANWTEDSEEPAEEPVATTQNDAIAGDLLNLVKFMSDAEILVVESGELEGRKYVTLSFGDRDFLCDLFESGDGYYYWENRKSIRFTFKGLEGMRQLFTSVPIIMAAEDVRVSVDASNTTESDAVFQMKEKF